ncbi:MAG: hypothetical protein IJZ86_01195 [Bacteroides sp.]|nr:hypothetical protein [Bacteroides sp.]
MAYLLLPPKICALNLEVDEIDFLEEIRNRESLLYKAYHLGYVKQLVESRTAIIKAARNGSNPAQAELLKYFAEVERHLKYE